MLYEQFGISAAGIDPSDQRYFVEKYLARVAAGTADIPTHLQSLVANSYGCAMRYYLMDDHVEAKRFAEQGLSSASTYFFGDWRERIGSGNHGELPPNPAWWHRIERWADAYSASLCWGAVLGDWEAVHAVSRYPDGASSMDIDVCPAYRQLLLDVSAHLRGGPLKGVADRVAALKGSTWRGTAVLGRWLDAIASRNADQAQACLDEFLKRRHKRNRSKDVTDTVSMDATFFLNLSQHDGLKLTVDPKLAFYIVRVG